jgi:hypothetical protein
MLLLHVHPSSVIILFEAMIKSMKGRNRKRVNAGGGIPLTAKLHGAHDCSSGDFLKP